jgi:hypothetical protein
MAFQILMAGQDITAYVDQFSLDIHDSLGQGAGAGNSGATQGRAATFKFNTSLGPMSTAIGAGQTIPSGGRPVLVRQGEVIIKDASGIIVFGGFATKYTDTTTSVLGQTKQNFTTVEGIDYSTSLQRVLINEIFTGGTDVAILRYLINRYASWINLQYLPANAAYTFETKNFRNVTLEVAVQTIAGITGYLLFVDYQKNLHYIPPTQASSAPFSLTTNPDFHLSFPHSVVEYLVDDNSAINRVFFYGGQKLSNDFYQDLSPLANGSNTLFPLAYYPSKMSDGQYHITVNGVAQVIGISGTADQLISQGGTCNLILDVGGKTITFDVAPPAGATVLAGYRYSYPLSLVLTDETSHQFFGNPYLDGSVDDNTIFDLPTAIQRCKVMLAQQSLGLISLKVDIYKGGLQSGMTIKVVNPLRGINATYLVQDVEYAPLGAGNFVYHVSLGAWNWNLIDYLLKLPTLSTFQDDQTDTQETIQITSGNNANVQVTVTTATRSTQTGVYYARTTPTGDGHDAYPGFSTIAS